MKNKPVMLLLALPFLVTGCELNNSQPTQPSQNFNNQLVSNINEYLKDQQIRYNCLANEQTYTIGIDFFFTDKPEDKKNNRNIRTASCTGNPGSNGKGLTQAQDVRNEVLEQGIAAIDANYSQYINDLNLGRATGNFVADVIELTTSGVIGALNGPASTLSALGVGLTTFRGARSSFDLNYFNKQTTAILVNQMDLNRGRVYSNILQKKERGIKQYSMREAIKDIVAYYNAGTLIQAFAALSQETASNTQQLNNEILHLQGLDNVIISQVPADIEEYGRTNVKASDIFDNLGNSLQDPNKKKEAEDKLRKIFLELEKDPEFKTYLSFDRNFSSQSDEGIILYNKLLDIRDGARSANNFKLLNMVNRAIIDFGS